MNPRSAAFVVSHPAHLLTVAGMLIRWRPSILILTKTETGPGATQGNAIRETLAEVGLLERTTFLDFDEEESYAAALSKDVTGQLFWSERIYDWLAAVRPDCVFGDAFEASNYQHDIGRLMLDEAIERLVREGHAIENYEFPLASQGRSPDAPLLWGAFLDDSGERFHLTDAEVRLKQEVVNAVRRRDEFVDQVVPLFSSVDTETYRAVPPDRDYTRPPDGLRRFYDEWGQKQVDAGKYEKLISFEEHFVPVVEALRVRRRAPGGGMPDS